MESPDNKLPEKNRSSIIIKLVNVIVLLFVLLIFLFVAFLFQCWNKGENFKSFDNTENNTKFCGNAGIDLGRAAINLSGDTKMGKSLFKANCATCHKFSAQLTGPALAGVFSRVPQPADEYLFKYIKNEKTLRKRGDKYALYLYQAYNKSVMPSFEFLTDDEIRAIVAFMGSAN